jgi:3-oxoacyl-[acyl-carrier protein] reductase
LSDAPTTILEAKDLRGRVALVTGVGRRRGIGSAVCRALASRGANIVFSYWTPYDREVPWAPDGDEPRALLGELRASGVGAEGVEMDLSLPDSARRLLDTAGERL